MLEGIETGYEDKFDFPHREAGPERVYIFASVPRSGSTYFSHLLWQSGCLGAPLEYLNFLPGSPYAKAFGAPARQTEIWRSILQRRTSPNGVFGIKCFPAQMRELQQGNPALFNEVMKRLLPADQNRYVVQLKRRDREAHAISFARAVLSGVWRKEQEESLGTTVPYDGRAVDQARRALDREEEAWQRLFQMQRIEPFVVWHEDVIADPSAAVASVARALDVALDPAAAVDVPRVEKQSQADAEQWAKQYRSSVLG
jgi:LPS sulfotransferase NodH